MRAAGTTTNHQYATVIETTPKTANCAFSAPGSSGDGAYFIASKSAGNACVKVVASTTSLATASVVLQILLVRLLLLALIILVTVVVPPRVDVEKDVDVNEDECALLLLVVVCIIIIIIIRVTSLLFCEHDFKQQNFFHQHFFDRFSHTQKEQKNVSLSFFLFQRSSL
jgi:hypothetical protein